MTKNEISGAVRHALADEIRKIHDTDKAVAAINERTSHMPTKDEVRELVADKLEACQRQQASRRRWNVGTLLTIAGLFVAIGLHWLI